MIDPPPGQARLFAVPATTDRYQVFTTSPYALVLDTDQLAPAVYAAGALSERDQAPTWIVSPDRWHATVCLHDRGWLIVTSPDTPTTALERILNHHHQGANQ